MHGEPSCLPSGPPALQSLLGADGGRGAERRGTEGGGGLGGGEGAREVSNKRLSIDYYLKIIIFILFFYFF